MAACGCTCTACTALCLYGTRLVKVIEESKRRAAKAAKDKHTAEVAAAEQRGKAEAERDTKQLEVRLGDHQQMQAAMMQLPFTAAASLSVCIIAAQRSTAVELFLSFLLLCSKKEQQKSSWCLEVAVRATHVLCQ